MTVSDAIKAVKVMLGQDVATEEVEITNEVETTTEELSEEATETVEVQFAEAVLVDGTVVYTEGELAEGAVLKVRTEEDEDPLAPAGKHETSEGLIVTVAEGGVIESIEEPGAEAVEAEVEEEEMEEEVKEELNAEHLLEAIADLIKDYKNEIDEVKEEMKSLTERFEAVADSPAASTVKKSYFEEAIAAKEVASARFDRLAALRNSSLKK